MKKIAALLLALCMIFALAACSSASQASAPTPEPKTIVGAWNAKLNFVEFAGEDLGDMAEIFKDINFDMVLEMKEDKTFSMAMDATSAMPALKEAFSTYLTKMIEAEGMTVEQFEELSGGTLDQLIEEALGELDFSEMDVSSSGTYTEENGKLVLTEENGSAMEGSWSEDTLTLNADGRQISFTRK